MADNNDGDKQKRAKKQREAASNLRRAVEGGTPFPEAAAKAFGVKKRHRREYDGKPRYLGLGRRTTRAVAMHAHPIDHDDEKGGR